MAGLTLTCWGRGGEHSWLHSAGWVGWELESSDFPDDTCDSPRPPLSSVCQGRVRGCSPAVIGSASLRGRTMSLRLAKVVTEELVE